MIEDLAKECRKPDWIVEKKDLSEIKKKLEEEFTNTDPDTTPASALEEKLEVTAVEKDPRFFEFLNDYFRNTNSLHITNEDILKFPDERSRLLHICTNLQHAGLDIDPMLLQETIKVAPTVQDRSPSIQAKVSNWLQFKDDCANLGLDQNASKHLKSR